MYAHSQLARLALALALAGLFAAGARSGAAEAPDPAPASGRQRAAAPRSPHLPRLGFAENELFGSYYFGDGLGMNCRLTLGANHRFTFSWRGCGGEYARNEGSWSLQGDVLVVKPRCPNWTGKRLGMNVRFVPIKWGPRVYLVDENETPGFCATVRSGKSPFFSLDYVKRESENPPPPVTGEPNIPQRYRDFYENGSIDAQVVEIHPDGKVILDVVIPEVGVDGQLLFNKGRVARLKPGMLLRFLGFEYLELKVTAVEKDHAVAEALYFEHSREAVKIGSHFTTGSYSIRPSGTGIPRLRRLPAPTSSQESGS